ncbi:MAG: hypothetical protein K0R81_293 [Microbacterium sp.]|jgi:beta-1,4-mannosyltransferase|nr:hypothetical protein [Microbacterium sp.]
MRVLHTVYPPSDQGNPFASLLIDALSEQTDSSYFSWGAAFRERWDVVHFQWPEKYFAASNPLVSLVKRLRFRAWMRLLKMRRTAIVLTIHNLATHEDHGEAAAAELARLDRAVDRYVALNPAVEMTGLSAPVDVIPHGHYRSVIPDAVRTPSSGRRLLYFGFIRGYKNVPGLIGAFGASNLGDRGHDLRIVGRPHTPEIATGVQSAADTASGQVTTLLEAVTDKDLYREIVEASVVVLPYADLYNSGALLMALSLERPVIAPRTAATEYYQSQFGEDWVILYDSPLAGDSLERAVATVKDAGERAELDLSMLDWPVLATAYVTTYRDAIAQAGRRS